MGSGFDEWRGPDGQLDRAALLSILPYGERFLFVDSVSELDETTIAATYRVPEDADWVGAHFRDVAVMPGVLVGEGLAQASTVLVRSRIDDSEGKHLLGFQIESALFESPVRPGDTLRYEVRLRSLRSRAARIEGTARVGDRTVCRAKLVLGIVAREELSKMLADLD